MSKNTLCDIRYQTLGHFEPIDIIIISNNKNV